MYSDISKFHKILLGVELLLISVVIIYALIGNGSSRFGLILMVLSIMLFVTLFPRRGGIIHQIYKKPINSQEKQTAEEFFHKEILKHEINKAKEQDINS